MARKIQHVGCILQVRPTHFHREVLLYQKEGIGVARTGHYKRAYFRARAWYLPLRRGRHLHGWLCLILLPENPQTSNTAVFSLPLFLNVPSQFVHILAYAAWMGSTFWTTFVAGITMMRNLPRQTFGKIQV